jgi:hypothetical protein
MDLTLIFATIQKPDPSDKDYLEIKGEEFGDIYLYKRPFLDEFLTKLQSLGTVTVYA